MSPPGWTNHIKATNNVAFVGSDYEIISMNKMKSKYIGEEKLNSKFCPLTVKMWS